MTAACQESVRQGLHQTLPFSWTHAAQGWDSGPRRSPGHERLMPGTAQPLHPATWFGSFRPHPVSWCHYLAHPPAQVLPLQACPPSPGGRRSVPEDHSDTDADGSNKKSGMVFSSIPLPTAPEVDQFHRDIVGASQLQILGVASVTAESGPWKWATMDLQMEIGPHVHQNDETNGH